MSGFSFSPFRSPFLSSICKNVLSLAEKETHSHCELCLLLLPASPALAPGEKETQSAHVHCDLCPCSPPHSPSPFFSSLAELNKHKEIAHTLLDCYCGEKVRGVGEISFFFFFFFNNPLLAAADVRLSAAQGAVLLAPPRFLCFLRPCAAGMQRRNEFSAWWKLASSQYLTCLRPRSNDTLLRTSTHAPRAPRHVTCAARVCQFASSFR